MERWEYPIGFLRQEHLLHLVNYHTPLAVPYVTPLPDVMAALGIHILGDSSASMKHPKSGVYKTWKSDFEWELTDPVTKKYPRVSWLNKNGGSLGDILAQARAALQVRATQASPGMVWW